MFYNPRLNDDEMQRAYRGYRSKEYREMRHEFEPWYSERFNAELASETHYVSRRVKLAPIFQQHLQGHEIRRVLDYGGDHGDLMLGLFGNAELFVYDISGATPARGVTATSDPEACQADLIINSNVLEHVGSPRTLVNEIMDAAPSGALIFLEVPCEAALGPRRIIRRMVQAAIVAVTRPSMARHVIRPAALYMMHEHVNYFTERSLTTLMQRCGGKVVASGYYPLIAQATNEGVVWCMAEKQS